MDDRLRAEVRRDVQPQLLLRRLQRGFKLGALAAGSRPDRGELPAVSDDRCQLWGAVAVGSGGVSGGAGCAGGGGGRGPHQRDALVAGFQRYHAIPRARTATAGLLCDCHGGAARPRKGGDGGRAAVAAGNKAAAAAKAEASRTLAALAMSSMCPSAVPSRDDGVTSSEETVFDAAWEAGRGRLRRATRADDVGRSARTREESSALERACATFAPRQCSRRGGAEPRA